MDGRENLIKLIVEHIEIPDMRDPFVQLPSSYILGYSNMKEKTMPSLQTLDDIENNPFGTKKEISTWKVINDSGQSTLIHNLK